MSSIYKIIFTGPVGAGKTTAIASISDAPPVTTDAKASDMTMLRKEQTTVAMDYGVIKLDNGDTLHLYGTPGQERFDFMWDILRKNGLGLMLLVDNRAEKPFSDLTFYLDAFKEFIQQTGVVVGITGTDVRATPNQKSYVDYLSKQGYNIPVFEVDARDPRDVRIMLEALLFSLANQAESE